MTSAATTPNIAAGGQQHESPEEVIYTWGGERGSAPSLSNQLRLSLHRVKFLACSGQCMVVTAGSAPDGDTLWTWGNNSEGQCGLGDSGLEVAQGRLSFVPVVQQPTPALTGLPIAQIAAEASVSGVLSAHGALFLAGHPSASSQRPSGSFTRQAMPTANPIVAFAIGQSHILAITAARAGTTPVISSSTGHPMPQIMHHHLNHNNNNNNPNYNNNNNNNNLNNTQLYSWGHNAAGQLGHGAVGAIVHEPSLLPFDWPAPLRAVACGTRHSVVALANGAVFAWGKNLHVAPSDEPEAQHLYPILGVESRLPEVPAPLPVKFDFARHVRDRATMRLCAGESHTVLSADGHLVWTWGRSTYGALGHGAAETHVPLPRLLPRPAEGRYAQCAAGRSHTLLLDEHRRVHAMGYARMGGLGLGQIRPNVFQPTVLSCSSTSLPYSATHIAAGDVCSMAYMRVTPRGDLVHVFDDDDTPNNSNNINNNINNKDLADFVDFTGPEPRIFPTLEGAMRWIETHPLLAYTEGLYRVEEATNRALLQLLFSTGEPFETFPDMVLKNAHHISFLVKRFFGHQPPLVPHFLFPDFLAASAAAEPWEKIFGLSRMIARLPPANHALFRRLYRHGMFIIANQAKNKMQLKGTARMWGNMSLPVGDDPLIMAKFDQVAEPILQYGHIILDDFLNAVFLYLYQHPQVGGATALELCDLMAKETSTESTAAAVWCQALQDIDASAGEADAVAALQATLASLRARFEQVKAQLYPTGTSTDHLPDGSQLAQRIVTPLDYQPDAPAHLTQHLRALIALVEDANDARAQRNSLNAVVWVCEQVLQAHKRAIFTAPPVERLHAAQPDSLTHNQRIVACNLNQIGEDPYVLCLRKLQELALQESSLRLSIATLEQQLEVLWTHDIDPALTEYCDFAHQRHERFETLLYTVIWPALVPNPLLIHAIEDLRSFGASVLEYLTAKLAIYARSNMCDQLVVDQLTDEVQLLGCALRCDAMSQMLVNLDDATSDSSSYTATPTPASFELSPLLPSPVLPPSDQPPPTPAPRQRPRLSRWRPYSQLVLPEAQLMDTSPLGISISEQVEAEYPAHLPSDEPEVNPASSQPPPLPNSQPPPLPPR